MAFVEEMCKCVTSSEVKHKLDLSATLQTSLWQLTYLIFLNLFILFSLGHHNFFFTHIHLKSCSAVLSVKAWPHEHTLTADTSEK